MSGIFMWLVRGYVNYTRRGLTMSDSLKAVVKQYEKDNDLVLQFLEARCEKEEDAVIKAKELYQTYVQWAKSEGESKLGNRKFHSEMERHEDWYDEKVKSHGQVVYRGIKLKEVI